ncbi:CLUMA_CG018400, isoform A [Clunio marinus]|uniref:CLUMA_CG018400, isoform A n=1 Tax=Clunio marinus TaxID=568069 RepID=A0A1J1J0R8_9DIPT|nr:CLUMA_CG018400, isoform A [Clunio marinus]
MEESGLNVLSDDVMLNIFEYLNSKTMKTATLVCKKLGHFSNTRLIFRWNEIIGTHASTMLDENTSNYDDDDTSDCVNL